MDNVKLVKMLEEANKEVENVKSGRAFRVNDLFVGYEWKSLSKSERHLIGILFKDKVKGNEIEKVILMNKKSVSGHVLYEKI